MIDLAICLVTHNQEQFISEAIESALLQKTNFSYKIYIGEDCSTDRSREICLKYKEKYPNRIQLIMHDENVGLVKNTITVFNEIRARQYKYIAMLDGDDYWTDNQKLQKQFDFMQMNPEYGLVHTGFKIRYGNKIMKKPRKNVPDGNIFKKYNYINIANCTVVFKTNLLDLIDLNDFIEYKLLSCDYAMYMIFAKYTKFKYFKETTAVWRRGHNSLSNTNNLETQIEYINNELAVWKYLDKEFEGIYGYNEISANNYRNERIFNIAFQFNSFKLANEIYKSNQRLPQDNRFVKNIAASNHLLFLLYQRIRKLKRLYILKNIE